MCETSAQYLTLYLWTRASKLPNTADGYENPNCVCKGAHAKFTEIHLAIVIAHNDIVPIRIKFLTTGEPYICIIDRAGILNVLCVTSKVTAVWPDIIAILLKDHVSICITVA